MEQGRWEEYPPLTEVSEGALPPLENLPPVNVDLLDRGLEATRDGPIRDPAVLLDTFQTVGDALPAAHIPDAGHIVYHELTKVVHLAASPDAADKLPPDFIFDRPEDVLKNTGEFAEYWWKPLRYLVDYHKGDESALDNMSPAWREALDPNLRNVTPGLQFLSFMLVHIKARDLASSLHATQVDERYHDDYTHVVNKLIGSVTDRLAPDLMPGHRLVRTVAKPLVVRKIADWREDAWQNSKVLDTLDEPVQESYKQVLDLDTARQVRQLKRVGGVALNAVALTERLPWLGDSSQDQAA